MKKKTKLPKRESPNLPDAFILGTAIASVEHRNAQPAGFRRARGDSTKYCYYRIVYKETVLLWSDTDWWRTKIHISDVEKWWKLQHHHKFEMYYDIEDINEILVIRALEQQSDF